MLDIIGICKQIIFRWGASFWAHSSYFPLQLVIVSTWNWRPHKGGGWGSILRLRIILFQTSSRHSYLDCMPPDIGHKRQNHANCEKLSNPELYRTIPWWRHWLHLVNALIQSAFVQTGQCVHY